MSHLVGFYVEVVEGGAGSQHDPVKPKLCGERHQLARNAQGKAAEDLRL
jgi:hypothetical protein